MKGLIVVNFFNHTVQEYQTKRLKEELGNVGLSTDVVDDAFLRLRIENGEVQFGLHYDFAVYLDKDKYIAVELEKVGVRVFNSSESIRLCDDKGETFLALSNHGIAMPRTIFAPLCYTKENGDNTRYKQALKEVAETLSFPLVVKESFGSMGTGVYLVNNFEELCEIDNKLKFVPHLYQEYLGAKKGTDVRVIVIGGKVVTAMQRENLNDFRSNIALGGSGRKIELTADFKRVAEKTSKILKLDYCGIDILYGDNGDPFVCEVNSNAFFKGAEQTTGINIAKLYARHILKSLEKERKDR